MSNILLKILIVVALILAGLVYYSNKIIHEKPIHEESVEVTTSVVMPHPPLSDKSRAREEEERTLNESNESEEFVEVNEPNSSSIELTPNVPKAEVEVIVDDSSLDEPDIVINDETEIIDDNEEIPLVVEEPPLVTSGNEVEPIENTPNEQIPPIEQPKIDLGTRIGGDEEKKQNVDLGVQLF